MVVREAHASPQSTSFHHEETRPHAATGRLQALELPIVLHTVHIDNESGVR